MISEAGLEDEAQYLALDGFCCHATSQSSTSLVSLEAASTLELTHQSAPLDQFTCWYHQKYGANARECTTPCNYTPPPNEKAGR